MSLTGEKLVILKENLRIGNIVTHPPLDNPDGVHIRSKVLNFDNDKVIVDINGKNKNIKWEDISWARTA
jgi:hypothetical protein